MSFVACIGLFAAVVATWIAISGPGEAALAAAGGSAAIFFLMRRARGSSPSVRPHD
jgi:hypothetical protein